MVELLEKLRLFQEEPPSGEVEEILSLVNFGIDFLAT